jgi:iron(III) transport system substrate-binding protein
MPSTGAAPHTAQEIATYHDADRQAVLEAGARREGTMLVYATNAQADPLYAAFGKKYPFIKVEALRQDGPTVARRMMEEYGAGTYFADTIDLNVGALRQMMGAGLLLAYDSPELAAFRPDAVEPGHHWALDYESYLSLGYNTNLIADADAPKTLDDLLDPKWQGKMAVAGTSTLPNWVGALLRDRGEAFVRKLALQKMRVYEVSARAVANLVVSGEVPLSPTVFNSHVAVSRGEGAPIAWRALGGVYSTTGGMALAAKPPHPNSAMLYIDFLLSQEGQTLYRKLGYASARKDLENADKPTKIYYLSDEPDYANELEKWQALGREITTKAH